ncbi:VPS13D [Cordylochernes scorpioides]|uniref:VPS13D n=1 Tax=Cordylochernes scorpioides TaxID=51811 RepID=A0ABY6LL87_9ARAC|nr:VPS13D [Cordylochernes scorpioides]
MSGGLVFVPLWSPCPLELMLPRLRCAKGFPPLLPYASYGLYVAPTLRRRPRRLRAMGQKVSGGIKGLSREAASVSSPPPGVVYTRPARVELLLDLPPAGADLQTRNGWSERDHSPNVQVRDGGLILHRHPVAQSTDGARGARGYSRGLHAWEVRWSPRQRGTHAVAGVATQEAPLQVGGYQSLVGSTADSWGWDLGRARLCHDSKHRAYPALGYSVPETFVLLLDMDEGTLAFMADGRYLGVAFSGLKGKTLYPAVSAVWGHCEVTLKYIGGLDPEPLPLKDLCRRVIRQQIGQPQLHRVKELEFPTTLKNYLLYQNTTAR